MSDYSDLIQEFGSASKDAVVTPHADLIKEFGSGDVQATAPLKITVNPNYPTPKTDAEISASQVNMPSSTFVQDIKNIPSDYTQAVSTNAKAGGALAGEGIGDISQGLPVSGVPKVLMGGLGFAASPLTGAIDVADKFAGKTVGNKDFKPTELLATTGLPIAKAGSIALNAMPSTRAIKTIIDTIGADNIPKILSELKSNPRLTLMDVDSNAQIVSMGLAAKPGSPRDILHNAVEQRKATEKSTVEGAYNDLMGNPVNIKDKLDALNINIKNVGKEINPIIASSKPVDISGVIQDIDNKLKPGVNSVISVGEPLPLGDLEKPLANLRKYLTDDKSVRTDAKSLHQFQSALRSKAEDMLNSTDGQTRQIGYALMNIRHKLVSSIDEASPRIVNADGTTSGSYRQALSKYRDENDIKDAFAKGQLITRNKLGQLEDRPEYWDQWIKEASPQELEAAKEGARDAVAQQMGSFRFAARKGENVGDIEFNRDKLKLLFGNKETEKMLKILSDEKKIADTNTKEFQNSMTAMRLLGAEKTKERAGYKPDFTKTILPIALEAGNQYLGGVGSFSSGLGMVAGLGYPAARSQITKIGQKLDRKTNDEIAKLASATGQNKETLIKALENYSLNKNQLTMKQKLQLALPTNP